MNLPLTCHLNIMGPIRNVISDINSYSNSMKDGIKFFIVDMIWDFLDARWQKQYSWVSNGGWAMFDNTTIMSLLLPFSRILAFDCYSMLSKQ